MCKGVTSLIQVHKIFAKILPWQHALTSRHDARMASTLNVITNQQLFEKLLSRTQTCDVDCYITFRIELIF